MLLVGLLRPDLAPPLTWREIRAAMLATLPTAGLIVAVLGAIFWCIATPTEASGIGAFGATLLALANGRPSFKTIRPLVAPAIKEPGINMVRFLVVMAVMLQTSLLTPPVGFSLFCLKGGVPTAREDVRLGRLGIAALRR